MAAISLRRKRDDYGGSDGLAGHQGYFSGGHKEELGTLGDVSKYIVSLQYRPTVNYNFALLCESFASPCIII